MCPIYGSFTGPRRSLKHFTQSGETFRCHRGKVGVCWSMRIGLLPGAYAWLTLCTVSCCSGCESSIGRCLPRRCSASCVRPTGWIPSAALPWSVQCWSCQINSLFKVTFFTKQMPDWSEWMIYYHPWPRPTHDLPDFLLHIWSIAMCGAFLAGRLILTVTASVKPSMGIIQ